MKKTAREPLFETFYGKNGNKKLKKSVIIMGGNKIAINFTRRNKEWQEKS